MKFKDLWKLSKGMKITGRTLWIMQMINLGSKIKFKKMGDNIMQLFKATDKIKPGDIFHKASPAQKYTYRIPDEDGYYWLDYINEMGDICPREPVEVYEDENLERVVAFIGSESVLGEDDLKENFGVDAQGEPKYRFQKILQMGDTGKSRPLAKKAIPKVKSK